VVAPQTTGATPHGESSPATLLTLSAAEVEELLTLEVAHDAAVIAAKAAPEAITGRTELEPPGGMFRVLVGAIPALDLVGYKQFHVANGRVRYLCHLFEMSTGRPTAVLDAQHITAYRTSGSAAAAVQAFFGSEEALEVAVAGSGAEARHGLRAVAAAVTVRTARVFSPNPGRREAFATDMSAELGIEVTAAESVAEATRGCDLVYAGTDSGGRIVIEAGDLDASVRMLVTVGSTVPPQRETAPELLQGAAVLVVDTPDVFTSSGDMIAAFPAGPRDHVLLGDWLESPVRDPGGLAVYKSIGSAEQDLVLAWRVATLAAERGVGTPAVSVSTERVLSKGLASRPEGGT
jgi:alanine dehydrogenase